jgi:hypothetical protein
VHAALPPAAFALPRAPRGSSNVDTSSRVVSGPRVTADEHRELGWIGVGVGAFAGLVAWRLIDADGKQTCGGGTTKEGIAVQCPHIYTTKAGGIAAAVGGALALTAGILVLSGTF